MSGRLHRVQHSAQVAARLDLPGVHASVHSGVALYPEGDYFGQMVNLAARMLDLAGNRELVASAAVVAKTQGRFDWEDRGSHRIRGVSEPVPVYGLGA